MRAACFSVATVDYFPQKDEYRPGGNALDQVVRFSELGVKTSFLGALGSDSKGESIHSLLTQKSVDISQAAILEGCTAQNRLINDEGGERYGEEGAWNGGVYESYRLPEKSWNYIKDFEIWTTHADCPSFDEAILRKKDNLLCVDYQHLPDYNLLTNTLEQVDIAYIGGDPAMVDQLLELSTVSDTLIVLTLGSQGSVAFQRGEKRAKEAIPTNEIVDTTGCGDAFQAAFTCSYAKHRDIRQALTAGAEMGLLTTQHLGGVNWQVKPTP